MSLRDELLPLLDEVREIPVDLGLRTYSVTIRTRTWGGGRVGLPVGSTPTHTDVTLTPAPRVRQLSQAEVDGSGGRYQAGDFKITGITPRYTSPTTGGYTPAMLEPVPTASQDVVYLLTGPEGALECTLVGNAYVRPFRYELVLRMKAPPPQG